MLRALCLCIFITVCQPVLAKTRLVDYYSNSVEYLNYEGTNALMVNYEGFRASVGNHNSEGWDYDYGSVGYTYWADNYMAGANYYQSSTGLKQGLVYGSYTLGTTTFGASYNHLDDKAWAYKSDKATISVAHIHNIGNFYVRGAMYGEFLDDVYDSYNSIFLSAGGGYNYDKLSVYASVRGEMDLYGAEGVGTTAGVSYIIDRIKLSGMYYHTSRDLLKTDYFGVMVSFLF